MPKTRSCPKPIPSCVRVHGREQGLPCPDCGGETFFDHDANGEQLVCIDCVAFAPALTLADCTD